MDKTLDIERTSNDDAKLHDAISKYIAEIKRVRAAMKKDQIEIERLKVETRSILAQLKAA